VSKRAPAALVLKQLAAFEAATRAIEEGHGDPAITTSRDPVAELSRRFEVFGNFGPNGARATCPFYSVVCLFD